MKLVKAFRPSRKLLAGLIGVVLTGGGLAVYWAAPWLATLPRMWRLGQFFRDPTAHPNWLLRAGTRCGNAPFIIPTEGYLGFGYGDSWQLGQRHQGLDIFSPTGLGQTPILAAYSGYLTRQSDWKSTLILRIPNDPLDPARQIWVYYTHMADPAGNSLINADFPPGAAEQYVTAGTPLGYQGNYSGDANNPTGVHLHFSIVRDDGQGRFRNELKIENTLDPSPYLGLKANWREMGFGVTICQK